MKPENRAGKYQRNLSGELEYESFIPNPLPPSPSLVYDDELNSLLSQASRCLGMLEGVASQIPDIDLFMAMYVRKEALMSSQIEGTQATLEDVLNPDINENVNSDVIDVVNYVRATEFAINSLKSLPLCCRLMRKVHEVLLSGVRGEEKYPGEFRRSQNWIGAADSTLKTAKYITPNPEDMLESMSELEKYINLDDGTDDLIRIALIHYQFETIHPFLDGNGRVGRLFITLYLMEKGILTVPALYISYFLKKNRIEYYDRMTEVRRTGNYEQWVKFFLNALIESSSSAVDTIRKLSKLHDSNVRKLSAGIHSLKDKILVIFRYIEENPILTINKAASDLGLSFNAVSSSVKRLCSDGILYLQDKKIMKSRIFYYKDYLEILRNGTE